MKTKYKRLGVALVVFAAGSVAAFPKGAWATAAACVPASELAEDGFVASASELEYAISEGISEVKIANDFAIECQPSIMTNSLKIDLNGKTVNANVPWALDIETSGKTLTIEDSGEGGVINFNDAGIWVEGGANLTINSGAIRVTEGRGRGIVFKDGVFNLNGGTVFANNGASGASYYPTIVLVDNGGVNTRFTIYDGRIEAANGTALSVIGGATVSMLDGEIIGGDNGVNLDDGAKFAMSDGSISASEWGVSAFNDTEFVMDGGTVNVTGSDGIGISGNGTSDPEKGNYGGNAKFTLNAGAINSGNLGVYAPQVNGMTVLGDGLTINAAKCGAEVRAGVLNVDGATINVDENADYAFNPNGSGSTASGVGVAVAQHTTTQAIVATVTDGNITAPVAFAEANPQENSEEAIERVSIAISGGSFVATNGDPIVASDDVTGFITGGVYSKAPEARYVADGYDAYDGGDGHYVLADNAFTVAFGSDEYSVTEGQSVEVSATVTPATIGVRERDDVTYAAYYLDGSVLANDEISISGNVVSARMGATGTYKLVATDMNGNTAEARLVVDEYYYVNDYSERYGVRVGGDVWYGAEKSDNVEVSIADETVARFETRTIESGDMTFEQTIIHGVGVGETVVRYALSDGRVVQEVPVRVYNIESTMKKAQAVGTSQTFTVDLSEGYSVYGFSASTVGMLFDDEGNAVSPVTYSMNEDGTYTVTVSEMPVYVEYEYDEETHEMILNESGEPVVLSSNNYPYVWVDFEIKDVDGNDYYEGYELTVFELAVSDEASEAVGESEADAAETNEGVMQGYAAEIIAEVIEHAGEAEESGILNVTLSDGTTATITNVGAFVEAVQNGEAIEMVLTEPEEKTDASMDPLSAAQLRMKIGSGKKGYRFVGIEVELRAGGELVGNLTDLGRPLTVSVDVSSDEGLAEGYTRTYFVARFHNGVATLIDNVRYNGVNKIVSFGSDEFSDFLIAYVDVADEPEEPTDEPSDEPSEEPAGEPTEESTDEPSDKPADEPTNDPVEPTDETTNETDTKSEAAGAADTGVFTGEGGSATDNLGIVLGIVSVIAVVAFIGAVKYVKER